MEKIAMISQQVALSGAVIGFDLKTSKGTIIIEKFVVKGSQI